MVAVGFGPLLIWLISKIFTLPYVAKRIIIPESFIADINALVIIFVIMLIFPSILRSRVWQSSDEEGLSWKKFISNSETEDLLVNPTPVIVSGGGPDYKGQERKPATYRDAEDVIYQFRVQYGSRYKEELQKQITAMKKEKGEKGFRTIWGNTLSEYEEDGSLERKKSKNTPKSEWSTSLWPDINSAKKSTSPTPRR